MPHRSPTPSPDGVHPAAPSGVASVDGVRPDAGPAADGAESELEYVREELAGLRAALVSRATIDQARGILIARYRISAEGAFDVLVRWSQERNIKLRTIAETLVALAQHGPDGAGVDRTLSRWLSQQLAEPSTGD